MLKASAAVTAFGKENWDLNRSRIAFEAPQSLKLHGGTATAEVGMEAILYADNTIGAELRGTKPDKDENKPFYAELATNPATTGVKYVRGHLINEMLGGPGKLVNLFPITEPANKAHSTGVEEAVKEEVLTNASMAPGKHVGLLYHVGMRAQDPLDWKGVADIGWKVYTVDDSGRIFEQGAGLIRSDPGLAASTRNARLTGAGWGTQNAAYQDNENGFGSTRELNRRVSTSMEDEELGDFIESVVDADVKAILEDGKAELVVVLNTLLSNLVDSGASSENAYNLIIREVRELLG